MGFTHTHPRYALVCNTMGANIKLISDFYFSILYNTIAQHHNNNIFSMEMKLLKQVIA